MASPSDLPQERQIVKEVIYEWNAEHSKKESLVLLPQMWEVDVYPTTGQRPQEAINEQIGDESDLLIALFWSKLGTHTGVASSGAVEEIELMVKKSKPCLIYFSEANLPNDVDLEQIQKLRQFKSKLQSDQNCLYSSFSESSELKIILKRNLAQAINSMFCSEARKITPSTIVKSSEEDSTYEIDPDKKRLNIQAEALASFDSLLLDPFCETEEKISILDAGCANGYVTYSRFSKYNNAYVTGIDIDKGSIEEADTNYGNERFSFFQKNIHELDVEDEKYDLVFSALVIHHLANQELVISKLWKSVKVGGALVIRGADDGLKLNYPYSPELDLLIAETHKIKGGSDRLFGRKMYTYAKRLYPPPANIEMKYDIASTANMTPEHRVGFFDDNYSYRDQAAQRIAKQANATKAEIDFANTLSRTINLQRERFQTKEDLFSLSIQPAIVIIK